PAAVGIELLGGTEQFIAAGTAAVHTLGGGVGVLTDVRCLGTGLAQHAVFLRIEAFAPLCIGDQLEVSHCILSWLWMIFLEYPLERGSPGDLGGRIGRRIGGYRGR